MPRPQTCGRVILLILWTVIIKLIVRIVRHTGGITPEML